MFNAITKLPLAYLFMLLLFVACQQNNGDEKTSQPDTKLVAPPSTTPKATLEEIITPKGYTVLAEAVGQLNADSTLEKVIIYDTGRSTDMGTEREIHVYRQENNQWVLWHSSHKAVLTSGSGGMMGDPFEALSIVKKCIVIEHFGGSRDKWHYLHRFRFQNNAWELIGATVEYGTTCADREDFDYNLSTGKIAYVKKRERCKDGEVIGSNVLKRQELVEKLDPLPRMDTFDPGNNTANIFGNGEMFYY